ncbi:MAG: hypothetical protein IKV43_04640, partial [Clostridia bacterium]|nr:hypothetical protein [Clostridia bacterium]
EKPKDEKHDHVEKGKKSIDEDEKLDYFEMECPKCENILSLDRKWDDLNEFTCPFCDTKLKIKPD